MQIFWSDSFVTDPARFRRAPQDDQRRHFHHRIRCASCGEKIAYLLAIEVNLYDAVCLECGTVTRLNPVNGMAIGQDGEVLTDSEYISQPGGIRERDMEPVATLTGPG